MSMINNVKSIDRVKFVNYESTKSFLCVLLRITLHPGSDCFVTFVPTSNLQPYLCGGIRRVDLVCIDRHGGIEAGLR